MSLENEIDRFPDLSTELLEACLPEGLAHKLMQHAKRDVHRQAGEIGLHLTDYQSEMMCREREYRQRIIGYYIQRGELK